MELTIDNRKLEINKRNNLRLSYRDLIFWQNNSIHINNENEIKTKLIVLLIVNYIIYIVMLNQKIF